MSDKDRNLPIEEQVWNLRHEINNLKQQVGPALERSMRLEDDVNELTQNVKELTKLIRTQSDTIARQATTINEMKTMMEGDKLNVGVYRRLQNLEEFVKWFREKKALYTGYFLGISAILTVGWLVAELILKLKDSIKYFVK